MLLLADASAALPGSETAGPAPAPSHQALAQTDQDVNAAIQQVIQRSNDEQAQAITSNDSSQMADTVTSDHLQESPRSIRT